MHGRETRASNTADHRPASAPIKIPQARACRAAIDQRLMLNSSPTTCQTMLAAMLPLPASHHRRGDTRPAALVRRQGVAEHINFLAEIIKLARPTAPHIPANRVTDCPIYADNNTTVDVLVDLAHTTLPLRE